VGEIVYLGLGSNLGDRLDTLGRAVRLLGARPGLTVTASSRVWETAPVGGPEQPEFLNAVVRASSDLSPSELLDACHHVESELGRVRDVRWGPRTIDIDILLIDERVVDETDLEVPHPRMTERAFVMLPLLELAPDVALPDGTRLRDLPQPGSPGEARPFAPALETT
jgi:2-amino-4-hydroxy-6-hydroxymethyldihydropteridine diphosphokinase